MAHTLNHEEGQVLALLNEAGPLGTTGIRRELVENIEPAQVETALTSLSGKHLIFEATEKEWDVTPTGHKMIEDELTRASLERFR